jgi:hypothetical protein
MGEILQENFFEHFVLRYVLEPGPARTPAKENGANPDPSPQDLPRTWDEIAPGHLVIARETLECGWWEAVVVERTGDLVVVRYRDYPQYPPMLRHRSAIALISPPAQ